MVRGYIGLSIIDGEATTTQATVEIALELLADKRRERRKRGKEQLRIDEARKWLKRALVRANYARLER